MDTVKIISAINNHIAECNIDDKTLHFLKKLKGMLLELEDKYSKSMPLQSDRVKMLLRSAGQRCFVDCFDIFRQASIQGVQGLEDKIKSCSGAKKDTSFRTKVSAGTNIFKDGNELIALEMIISANRVDVKTKEKAMRLFVEEKGKRNDIV